MTQTTTYCCERCGQEESELHKIAGKFVCPACSQTTTCLATGCRKRARFFGRWAGGGFCLTHATQYAEEYGLGEFHAADRTALQQEMANV